MSFGQKVFSWITVLFLFAGILYMFWPEQVKKLPDAIATVSKKRPIPHKKTLPSKRAKYRADIAEDKRLEREIENLQNEMTEIRKQFILSTTGLMSSLGKLSLLRSRFRSASNLRLHPLLSKNKSQSSVEKADNE